VREGEGRQKRGREREEQREREKGERERTTRGGREEKRNINIRHAMHVGANACVLEVTSTGNIKLEAVHHYCSAASRGARRGEERT
jgi:hypothetical protein